MAELVLGSVLGAAFTVLHEAVSRATVGKFKKFKPLLGDLQATLESIQPLVIQQIGEYNMKLKLPNDEIDALDRQMREGKYLIQKLAKLGWWNHIKSHHSCKLVELDGSLQRLLKHIVMQQARDIKELLIVTKQTSQQIVELQEDSRRFSLALHDSGKQLVEFHELNERLLQERTLLQEGARDLQKTFVLALENNEKQLVHLHGVVEQMMKQQGAKGVTDAETGDSNDDWFKPNEAENGVVEVEELNLLFEGVQLLINKDVISKPVLKSIECTLDSLKPLEELLRNRSTRHPRTAKTAALLRSIGNNEKLEALRTQMREGVKLFKHLLNLQTWNMYIKFKYGNKLLQWAESLPKIWKRDHTSRENRSEPNSHAGRHYYKYTHE